MVFKLISNVKIYVKIVFVMIILTNIFTWYHLEKVYNNNDFKELVNFIESVRAFNENDKALKNISTILKVCEQHKIVLVLLDPRFTEEEKNISLISLAIFENQTNRFHRMIIDNQLKYILTTATDYRKFQKTAADSKSSTIKAHYFLTNVLPIMQISILYNRNDYYWIPTINLKNKLWQSASNLKFPMAVEKFGCAKKSVFGFEVCIPANFAHYQWQLEYAEFLECKYYDVVWPYHEKYGVGENFDLTSRKHALGTITRLAKNLHIPLVIFFGTLLGWYRQCDYIRYSYDVDTVILEKYFNVEVFHRFWRMKNLTLAKRLGTPYLGLEFRFKTPDLVSLDLFLNYENHSDSHTFVFDRKIQYKQPFPIIDKICSADLWGLLIYVPCDPLKFIESEYNSDSWRVPKERAIRNNMNEYRKFNDMEWSKMIYYYKRKNCTHPTIMWGCDQRVV